MKSLLIPKKILFFMLLIFLRALRPRIAGGGFFYMGKNMKDGNETGKYNLVLSAKFQVDCDYCAYSVLFS